MSTDRITVYCCEVCAKPVETNYPERCDEFEHVLRGAEPREFVPAAERDCLVEALREAKRVAGDVRCGDVDARLKIAAIARAALEGKPGA